jgi:hypothetical protein
MMRSLPIIAIAAAAMVAGPVAAAVLTLDCRVESRKPGYSRRGIRRLEIDLTAKTVRVSDNTGKGFQFRGVRPLVSVDANRIVLENAGGKTSAIDRHTGRYMFRNAAERLVIQGRCAKVAHGAGL